MDQRSMDPLFGPGAWTIFMDRVHGRPVMDQVQGQKKNKNRNSAKKRFDEILSTNAHD